MPEPAGPDQPATTGLSSAELASHAELAEALERLRANAVVVLGNATCALGFSLEDHWDAAVLAATDATVAAMSLQVLLPLDPRCLELSALVSLVAADLGALDANRLGAARLAADEAARYASLLPFSIIAAIEAAAALRANRGLPA